jgi:hypothetical protein
LRRPVEEDKDPTEKGKLLFPRAYGQEPNETPGSIHRARMMQSAAPLPADHASEQTLLATQLAQVERERAQQEQARELENRRMLDENQAAEQRRNQERSLAEQHAQAAAEARREPRAPKTK